MNQSKDLDPEPDYIYAAHVVAFLDLLGHKEKLLQIEGIINKSPTEIDRERIKITLRETIGVIQNFRKSFTEFFELLTNHPMPKDFPLEFQEKFKEYRAFSKINFQNFSDSVIIWTRIVDQTEINYLNSLNSLYGILGVVALLYPLYLSQNAPFRGGIDVEGGILISSRGNEIYGPALNRAYTLECKDASYPRVLIGKGVIDFLDFASKYKFKDPLIQGLCLKTIENCKQWMVTDEDGKLMVHFLGPQAKALLLTTSNNFIADIFNPMEQFILDSQKKFESNDKLKERYDHLRNYFDKYVHLWR